MTGKICGTGSWAPDRVWDNNDLAKMVETSDQWIRERTGVVQRLPYSDSHEFPRCPFPAV